MFKIDCNNTFFTFGTNEHNGLFKEIASLFNNPESSVTA